MGIRTPSFLPHVYRETITAQRPNIQNIQGIYNKNWKILQSLRTSDFFFSSKNIDNENKFAGVPCIYVKCKMWNTCHFYIQNIK